MGQKGGRRRKSNTGRPSASGRSGRATPPKSAWSDGGIPSYAPKVAWLRDLYGGVTADLDEFHKELLRIQLPRLDYDKTGTSADVPVEPAEAWGYLEQAHAYLVAKAYDYAERRGSAEWLFWLRRLRGQFNINSLDSTDAYIQILVEALAAGYPSESETMPDVPTLVFEFDEHTLTDLFWIRHAAIQIYRLHATMRRCAKGQSVLFRGVDVPYAVPDEIIEEAIADYDLRGIRAGGSVLDAVGLHKTARNTDPDFGAEFGGMVPLWMSHQSKRTTTGILSAGEPPRVMCDFLDLAAVPAFSQSVILTEAHIALIALLWASFHMNTREPGRTSIRFASSIQFGYAWAPTENYLRPALDESLNWLRATASPIIPTASVPESVDRALEVLEAIEPSAFPPLCGSPIHVVGDKVLIDLTGASHRLVETLVRPIDGTGANHWSNQFEADVQSIVDVSEWAPTGEVRKLIGRVIKKRDKSHLTDLDAIALKGAELVVISCKSMALTEALSRGDHNAVRSAMDKCEKAVGEWDAVVLALRSDPELLRVTLPGGINITGLVVVPSIPYVVQAAMRTPSPPLGLPAVVASTELADALRERRPRRKR